MENNIRVSVIIPVYNAEKYLRECLDSVVNQTLREIEIICVDDGSTDNSLAILREYEARDTRVKVLTQENQYAGVARNNGMSLAFGKYYIFWDADDFFELDALELMYARCEEYQADICICGADKYSVVSKKNHPADWMLRTPNAAEPFSRETVEDIYAITSPAPWNKLISAALVEKWDLKFQALPRVNDAYFTLSALALADRIVTVNKPLIHYRVGQRDNLQSGIDRSPTVICEALLAVREKLEEAGYWNEVEWSFLNCALDNIQYNLRKADAGKAQLVSVISNKYWTRLGFDNHISSYYKAEFGFEQICKEIEENRKENSDGLEGQPKVSVLIPVYNVENYLAECLESVMRQTLSDIEIICVDDGSTDNSRNILLEYAERDPRIKLVLKDKNEGLLLARKAGFAQSNGQYIMFLDSDDYLTESACEKAYSLIEKHRVDILQFSAGVINCTGDPAVDNWPWWEEAFVPVEDSCSDEAILHNFYIKRNHTTSMLGKIYKATIIRVAYHSIPNFYNYVGEDIYQQFLFAFFARSFKGIKTEPLYWYRYGAGVSNTQNVSLTKFEQYCRMAELVERIREFLYKEHSLKEHGRYCEAMAERMMTDCCRMYKNRMEENDKKAGGKLLLQYWSAEPVAERVFKNVLSISMDEFKRSCIDIPIYIKQGTAYPLAIEPKVSVIIPVYNVEKYLRECLDSVVNQTLREIEIICVNDGSWDNSLQIIEEYAEKDNRITVISQQNAGPSIARNAALSIAAGKYVYMLDSDDLIESNTLESLYEHAEQESLDILFFDAKALYMSGRLRHTHGNYNSYYRRKDYYHTDLGSQVFRELVTEKEYRASPVLQFVRREHLEQHRIRFLAGIIHEDNLFTFLNIMQAERVALINEPYYIRRIREDSIMTRPTRFANTYGYLMCFAHMASFVTEHPYDESVMSAAMTLIDEMRRGVQRTYGELSNEERAKVAELKPLDQIWFELAMLNVKKREKAALPKAAVIAKAYGTNEAALIRASWSYRIGRFITWPYRMVRGFFRCYREHGWNYYTWHRVLVHLRPKKIVHLIQGFFRCCQEHGWRYTWRRVLVKLHLTKY